MDEKEKQRDRHCGYRVSGSCSRHDNIQAECGEGVVEDTTVEFDDSKKFARRPVCAQKPFAQVNLTDRHTTRANAMREQEDDLKKEED